jgi:8-oxo-dGTP diphosphatase
MVPIAPEETSCFQAQSHYPRKIEIGHYSLIIPSSNFDEQWISYLTLLHHNHSLGSTKIWLIENRLTQEILGGITITDNTDNSAEIDCKIFNDQSLSQITLETLYEEVMSQTLYQLFTLFDYQNILIRMNHPSIKMSYKSHYSRQEWFEIWQNRPLLLVVAAALIDSDGRLLLAQRPKGKSLAGQWEFPGGKLEHGEIPQQALIRELKEELNIDVSSACLAPITFASHDYPTCHLLMPVFACRQWQGRLLPLENQALAWVKKNQLHTYTFPPADIGLVALLRDWL